MDTNLIVGLVSILVALLVYILLFLWQKHIATDLLREKGYDKHIGALLFFMPIVCWIYVCALPNKSNK